MGEPRDETGCGDTFLMGYTWAFLQTGDRTVASRFANRVAGINVCLRGIEGIGQIGQFLTPEDLTMRDAHQVELPCLNGVSPILKGGSDARISISKSSKFRFAI